MVAIRIVPRTELPPRTEPLPACAVSFQLKLDRLMRRGNPDIGDAYSGFARFRFYLANIGADKPDEFAITRRAISAV